MRVTARHLWAALLGATTVAVAGEAPSQSAPRPALPDVRSLAGWPDALAACDVTRSCSADRI